MTDKQNKKMSIAAKTAIWLGSILVIMIVVIVVILRTSLVYDWSNSRMSFQELDQIMQTELDKIEQNENDLDLLQSYAETSGDLILQTQAIQDFQTRNKDSLEKMRQYQALASEASNQNHPLNLEKIFTRRDDVAADIENILAQQIDELDKLALINGLLVKYEDFLTAQDSNNLTSNDLNVIYAEIANVKAKISNFYGQREMIENSFSVKLENIHIYQDKQNQYYDELKVFHDLRELSISNLRLQQDLLNQIENEIEGVDIFSDFEDLEKDFLKPIQRQAQRLEDQKEEKLKQDNLPWNIWKFIISLT